MIQAYVDGQDLYAFMASRVFSLVASRTAEKLNAQLGMATREYKSIDPKTQADHLAPLNRQLVKDCFVYYDDGIEAWSSKELKPENCFDGSLYRRMMKTLLLGGITPHRIGETLGEPYYSGVSINVA